MLNIYHILAGDGFAEEIAVQRHIPVEIVDPQPVKIPYHNVTYHPVCDARAPRLEIRGAQCFSSFNFSTSKAATNNSCDTN